jgi:hypothetical protein
MLPPDLVLNISAHGTLQSNQMTCHARCQLVRISWTDYSFIFGFWGVFMAIAGMCHQGKRSIYLHKPMQKNLLGFRWCKCTLAGMN